MKHTSERLSLHSALRWIFFITLCVTGSASLAVFYYRHLKAQRLQQPQYNIVALIQTTPDKERLKTIYLAELLGLSIDQPTNLFRLNINEARQNLLKSPLITTAKIKKILPGTLYIEYSLRKPFAYVIDFTNTVVDKAGVAFPFKPFFTPKKIPEIYLGLDKNDLEWGEQIKGVKIKVALYLIDFFHHNLPESTSLVRVDVSHAFDDSYGNRQVVVMLEESLNLKMHSENIAFTIPHILRLSLENYKQEISNYLVLRPLMIDKGASKIKNQSTPLEPLIIDLRISGLAYISNG